MQDRLPVTAWLLLWRLPVPHLPFDVYSAEEREVPQFLWAAEMKGNSTEAEKKKRSYSSLIVLALCLRYTEKGPTCWRICLLEIITFSGDLPHLSSMKFLRRGPTYHVLSLPLKQRGYFWSWLRFCSKSFSSSSDPQLLLACGVAATPVELHSGWRCPQRAALEGQGGTAPIAGPGRLSAGRPLLGQKDNK